MLQTTMVVGWRRALVVTSGVLDRICAWYDVLATQSEFADDCAIALNIDAGEIVEQTAAATNNHQQAASAVVIFFVGLQVLGQMRDAVGQQCDLDFGRTRVVGATCVFRNRCILRGQICSSFCSHRVALSYFGFRTQPSRPVVPQGYVTQR